MKGLKVLLGVLLFIVLLLLVPLTAPGSRYMVELVNDYTPLELVYGSGSLLGELELKQLRLPLESTDIALSDVTISVEFECLLFSKICLRQLHVRSLKILIAGGDDSAPPDASVEQNPAPEDGDYIVFPVWVEAPSVSVDKLSIQWANGGVGSALIDGGFSLHGSQLILSPTRATGFRLVLQSEESSEPDTDGTRIALPELFLPFDLIVEKLQLEKPSWRLGDIEHQHDYLRLSGDWGGRTLSIDKATISSEQWAALSVNGSLGFYRDWPIDMVAEITTTTPPLWEGLHHRVLMSEIWGDLGRLELSASSAGSEEITLEGAVDTLDRELPFSAKVSTRWQGRRSMTDLSLPEPGEYAVVLDSGWQLEANGTLVSQTFSVAGQGAALGYDALELAFSGSHENQRLQIDSLTLLDEPAASELRVNGAINFEQAIGWDLTAESSGLDLSRFNADLGIHLAGTLGSTGSWQDSGWSVALDKVDLRGKVNGLPAAVTGHVNIDDSLLLGATGLEATANGAHLELVSAGNDSVSLALEVSQLGDWLQGSHGAISLAATVTRGQQQFAVTGQGRELELFGVNLPTVALQGSYRRDAGQDFSAQLIADNLNYSDLSLNDVQLSLSGDRAQQMLALNSKGDIAADLQLKGGTAGDHWRGVLQQTTIGTPAGEWQSDGPVTLDWRSASEAVATSSHCWRGGNSDSPASLCFDDLVLGASGSGKVKLHTGLALLNSLTPDNMTFDGMVDGAANVVWTPDGRLTGDLQINLSAGELMRTYADDEAYSIDWDSASVSGNFQGDRLVLSADVWRRNSRQVAADLSIGLDKEAALSGSITANNFELSGVLKPFFPMISAYSGDLNGTLALSGTGRQPLLNGTMALRDGAAALIGNPTTVEEINLSIDAKGQYADINGGLLLGGGETSVSGQMVLQPQFGLDLKISGQNQKLYLPPGTKARISEELRLVTSADAMQLTGKVIVHEGLLEHEQLPPGSVELSDDVVEVDYEGREISDSADNNFSADVKVEIENAFKVVGTGLDSVVGGKLRLKKVPARPLQLFGELNIVSGQIEVFGQILRILQGNMAFSGVPDNPDLNFRAERQMKDKSIKVGVQALGSLQDFAFQLYSNPPMSESEMMSYLIYGKGIDKGGNFDGTAVALSMGFGVVNQTGLVKTFNKIPGVSNLEFGTDETSDNQATATVGGYLGERIYLSYGVGIYEPINVLTAKFFILPKLWLEVVSSLKSSADVYYSFEVE